MAPTYRLVVQSTTHIGPYTSTSYTYAGLRIYGDRNQAIEDGRAVFGDDEFHLATLDGDTLVAFGWWEEDWVDGNANLEQIAEHLGLRAPAQTRSK